MYGTYGIYVCSIGQFVILDYPFCVGTERKLINGAETYYPEIKKHIKRRM